MSGINKAIILGNVGSDPLVTTPGGSTIAKFSVATSEKWTDKGTGEIKEKTEWHRISCFGKLADIVGKYVVKGSQVYVEGKIRTSEYEKEGIKRYSTEIIADTVQFLGSAKRAQSEDLDRPAALTANNPSSTASAPLPKPAAGPKPPAKPIKNFAPGADNSEYEKSVAPSGDPDIDRAGF